MSFFERVVVINLDRRRDRLGAMRAKLADVPDLAHWERVRAVHGDTVGVPSYYTAGGGAWGCLRSHCRVLEDALLDGVETLLVLEDDARFCPNFSTRLREFMAKVPPDWDGLMLGGQNHGPPPEKTGTPGVLRSANTQRTHAYAVRGGEPMKALLRLWTTAKGHIDHILGRWQGRFDVYEPEEFLVGQDEGQSDIFGRGLEIRYWSTPAPVPATAPLYFLKADRPVAERLRQYGLHYGYDLDPETGRDRGLVSIEAGGWPPDRLVAWADLIAAEAAEAGGVPALWHVPAPNPKFIAAKIGRPVREVEAETAETAVALIPELVRAKRAADTVWCWRHGDYETLEGLKWHGFHRGHWTDDVSGLDNGLRRLVAAGRYAGLKKLVEQLDRELHAVRRGKPLLAHPDLDVAQVRASLPGRRVVELTGPALSDILAQVEEATRDA